MTHLLRFSSSVVALAVVAGCAVEPAPEPGIRKGTSTTPAPGQENKNGEHGTNAPAGATKTPEPGIALGSEQWADGKKIDGNVTISEGATVEIAPGALITIAADVAITVKGTLKVAATEAKHSKLTGKAWAGLLVAKGGTLDANGLDIEGATSALWTQNGNTAAKVTNGIITAETPFKMEAGSNLTITKTTVTATSGSTIAGNFIASYMTYDKGTAAGLTLNDPAGSMTFTDSILKGKGGGDYVISSAGKLVKLEYTTISGSHCALHFSAVDKFSLDHVSLDANNYGGMLYGSGAGPNSITSSNIQGTEYNLQMNGTNGPLTIGDSYLAEGAITVGTPEPINAAAVRLIDAKPR